MLHRKFEAMNAVPEEIAALTEFDTALHELADRTRDAGIDLIHNLVSSGADFATRLRAAPARIPASLPAFASAIVMLGWLGLHGREAMVDISGALVYAMDEDLDNCECLSTAFGKVALHTKYSPRPDIAVEQLSTQGCDLIVLDVDRPGMDGFELHERISQMPTHAQTPIIFISGDPSTLQLLEALSDVNHQFVAKPYSLSEMSMRALTMIVEARLG